MMSASYVCLAQGVARHSAAREQLQTARARRRAREKRNGSSRWKCKKYQTEYLADLDLVTRPRGPMDKASAYEAGDCRFESCRGHIRAVLADAIAGNRSSAPPDAKGMRHGSREYTQINVSRGRQQAQIKCISRESSPGHIDGNDVFCH